jgi:hypothetical protein
MAQNDNKKKLEIKAVAIGWQQSNKREEFTQDSE